MQIDSTAGGPTVQSSLLQGRMLMCVLLVAFISMVISIVTLVQVNDIPTETPEAGGRDEYLQDRKKVVIAMDPTWPPFCMQATKDGVPFTNTGFLVEMAKEACKLAGMDCVFQADNYLRCWGGDHHAGDGLRQQNYDMCLCWTNTYQRQAEVIYPNQFTNNVMGGLMALKVNADSQSWRDSINLDGDLTGARIGVIKGWATNIDSFDYIRDERGALFNKGGITFVDESVDQGTDIENINHLVDELDKGNIDLAYLMETAIEDHRTDDCAICQDHNIWKTDKLTMVKTRLQFAAAGASGFLRMDRTALRDQLNVGIDAFIAKKDQYCPLCKTYWPLEANCIKNCIGCEEQCKAN